MFGKNTATTEGSDEWKKNEKERLKRGHNEDLEKLDIESSKKILSVTLRDYLECMGSKLSDYEIRGINAYSTCSSRKRVQLAKDADLSREEDFVWLYTDSKEVAVGEMLGKIKKYGAEAVVDAKYEISESSGTMECIIYGTALVPKKVKKQ